MNLLANQLARFAPTLVGLSDLDGFRIRRDKPRALLSQPRRNCAYSVLLAGEALFNPNDLIPSANETLLPRQTKSPSKLPLEPNWIRIL